MFYELGNKLAIDLNGVTSVKGRNYSFALTVNTPGWYKVTVTASSTQSSLAQIPVTLFAMGTPCGTLTWNGTNGEPASLSCEIPMFSKYTAIRIYFAQNGLDMCSIDFELVKKVENMDIAFAAEE